MIPILPSVAISIAFMVLEDVRRNQKAARERASADVAGLGVAAIPSSLGTIVSATGYTYRITANDLLWLARSVQYEGGNNLATAWTYAQRQVLYRRTGSLASLVQGHSQPVNPIWRRDGAKCRPGGPYHGSDSCSESRLARRDEAANLPWSEIDEGVRNLLLAWASGETRNPAPRATDFADQAVSEGFISRNPGTVVVLRSSGCPICNWYIAERRAVSWPAGFVDILPPGAVAMAAGGSSVLLLAAAGGGAWWYFNKGPGRLRGRR